MIPDSFLAILKSNFFFYLSRNFERDFVLWKILDQLLAFARIHVYCLKKYFNSMRKLIVLDFIIHSVAM